MASLASGSVVRQIGLLFEGSAVSSLSDRQLLERFVARRDSTGEAAFAALVVRHGPMVLGVCRQLLGDRHDAEDAFQAVFLVLAQKAGSIRDPDLLGNWIYGVAVRTSRCAKARLGRAGKFEEVGSMLLDRSSALGLSAEQSLITREQADVLHGEIERLPRAFRLPVVLCYLEGLTVHEAARRLRCSHGTVRSRMARAREKLRRALTRRGVIMPAAALAAGLDPRSASASVSSPLCEMTTQAAIRFGAGESAAPLATALANEVLRSMLVNKLKLAAMCVFVLAAGVSGAGYFEQALASEDEPKRAVSDRQAVAAARTRDKVPPAGRMYVVGRVIDPAGKAIAGVSIEIIGRPREPWLPARVDGERRLLLGRGVSTADGRYRLEASRTAADRFFEVYALAAAPGFGLAWAELNPNADEPAAEIRLQPEQVIRGKLVDIHGQPAAHVELKVWCVGRPSKIGTFDGVNIGADVGISPLPDEPKNWPRPIATDLQGRFTIAGTGREAMVGVNVRGPGFASQTFRIEEGDRDGSKELTLTLQPATIVEGHALAGDTGQPIARTAISLSSGLRVQADDQGAYAANLPPAAGYQVEAFPPQGQPYLAIEEEFKCAKGTVKLTKDIKLPRGVLVRGKVIEQGSGRPIGGATVQWIAARPKAGVVDGWQSVVATKDDGSYEIVVLPGKGHLFVYGPTSDYVLEMIGGRMIHGGKPGGKRYYAHDILAYELSAGDSASTINSELRPGRVVKGRLVGPSGETVDKAEIVALLHFNYFHLNWRGDLTIHALDGSFELHGLDPEQSTRVSFLDAEHQWGTTLELSGKDATEEVTVRLAPCGQAKARFVRLDGKPVANIFPHFEILGSSGPPDQIRKPEEKEKLAADAAYLPNLDRKHYWNGRLTDADGRITLPDLIPGALYRISDWSTVNGENKGAQVRRDFTVKPGETVDLGDILIEKPAQ